MTEKEIKALQATLPQWENGKPPVLTQEQKILQKKISIMTMMVSNLCYGEDYFKMVKEPWYVRNHVESRGYDWDELKALGVKYAYQEVQKMWKDMKNSFKKHATIHYNVHTDSEGLSYNSIEWDDE